MAITKKEKNIEIDKKWKLIISCITSLLIVVFVIFFSIKTISEHDSLDRTNEVKVSNLEKDILVATCENGFDCNGFNKDGFDTFNYDEDGYNIEGYNREGYNSYGYNREGL